MYLSVLLKNLSGTREITIPPVLKALAKFYKDEPMIAVYEI